MRYCLYLYSLFLYSCGNVKSGSVEIRSTHHHHLALEAIKSSVSAKNYFEVHQWYGPDTLSSWPDTAVRIPIRYKMDFDYKEKSHVVFEKYAIVVINGQTDSILVTDIFDRQ